MAMIYLSTIGVSPAQASRVGLKLEFVSPAAREQARMCYPSSNRHLDGLWRS